MHFKFLRRLLGIILVVCVSSSARADIIQLVPTGNAGVGLLSGNVFTGSTNAGSGGVGSTGITLDTNTNILHIDIEWGSENGYDDLSGNVTMLHFHGMTDDPAPDSFNQVNSNILINLGNSLNFDNSATGGGLVDDFFVDTADIAGILEGRAYINVHTDLNPLGEIRGYLVVIPEPNGSILLAWLFLVLLYRNKSERR